MSLLLGFIVVYLVASFNFAYLVARLMKVDITTEGSGNPGSANVLRVLGKKAAVFVLLGDLLKGFMAPYILLIVFSSLQGSDQLYLIIRAGFFTILGHCFPIYYQFKGGKGVASFIGFIIFLFTYFTPNGLSIYWILFLVGLYFIVFKASKISALASLSVVWGSSFIFYTPLTVAISNEIYRNPFIHFLIIILLITWKHKDNFNRIIKGDENKF
jgi:glycerol-3-phosphate acyltransferase PlsY